VEVPNVYIPIAKTSVSYGKSGSRKKLKPTAVSEFWLKARK